MKHVKWSKKKAYSEKMFPLAHVFIGHKEEVKRGPLNFEVGWNGGNFSKLRNELSNIWKK